MNRPRLLIAGGGPVGLALACSATGCDVTVIEAGGARAAASSQEFDARVFALSPGTRALLRDLGAWQRLDWRRIGAARHIEIFGDAGARLAFDARAGGALASIVEASGLGAALEAQAESLAHVSVRRSAQAVAFGARADGAWVELHGGERIEGDLLVGADGPDSRVRAMLGLAFEERPYGEAAIVANFKCETGHGDVARQWFRSDGVLAWLPLPGKHISIVWSTALANADEIASLDARDFERRVRDAGASALGDLRLVSTVARIPLRLIEVSEPVAAGVALIGDAAHAVHPLAGQGVNLGFQDVKALVEVMAERSPLERPGDLRVLRRYARARREDVAAMQFVTDGLDKLFSSGAPGAYTLRNLGLKLVESQPWVKAALTRRAMR